MNNIQESIFKAIDVITDKKIGTIKFDKTIECIIESDAEADKGKYTAKYQDIIINIFSNNNTVKYRHGTNVYVLVPQGDFSNKKTIIGKVENSGEEFISIEDMIDKMDIFGENYVDEPEGFKCELVPDGEEKELLRELAFKNDKFIADYKNKLNLLIGCTIKSHLPSRKGDFGLHLDLVYKNGVEHQYRVSIDSMVGNPYSLNNKYQYKVFPLLLEEVAEITGMYLYIKGFKKGMEDQEEKYFVEFSNIEVAFAKPKDADDLDQFKAYFKAEKGTVFKNGKIDNDATLTLEMIPEKMGKPFKPNAVYKWFYSDLNITQGSEGWDVDGGDGWHIINPPKKEKFEQLKGMSLSEDEKILTLTPVAVPNLETFKCVAIFGGETITFPDGQEQTMGVIKVEAIESIVDQSDSYNVVILSTRGDVFKPGDGIDSTDLVCKVYCGLNEAEPDRFLYSWGKVMPNGDIQPIKTLDTSEKLTIENIDGIINTESYVCEVYSK